jgi:putative membrane protein
MRANTLKASLLGAFLSLGAIAAGDVQSKHMKDNAEFVEKAAMVSKTQVNLSELAISQSTNSSVKQFAEKVIADHKKAFDSLKSAAQTGGYSLPFQSIGSGVTSSSGEREIGDAPEADARRASDVSDTPGEQIGDAAKRSADDLADSSKEAAKDVEYGAKKVGEDVTGSPTISQSKEFAKASEKAQEKYNDLAKLTGEKFDKAYLSNISSGNDKAINLLEKASKDGWDSDLKSWADETLPTLREHKDMAKSVKNELKNTRPSM